MSNMTTLNARHVVRTMLGLALLGSTMIAVAAAPAAHADGPPYGPDTCLQGYVWREAVPGDHVCVTPATRAEAAYDNSQAAARRNPAGGPYGPDTCLQGYVWREAVPGDHVCVTPATRAQAAYDNSQAGLRRVGSPTIWLTDWTVPPVCNGSTCTSTSTDDIPRFKVNGDHFSLGGQVWIGIMRSDTGARTYRYHTTATAHSGYAAGSFGVRTMQFDCASDSRAPVNYYVQAYDWSTGVWSNRIYIKVCRAVL